MKCKSTAKVLTVCRLSGVGGEAFPQFASQRIGGVILFYAPTPRKGEHESGRDSNGRVRLD